MKRHAAAPSVARGHRLAMLQSSALTAAYRRMYKPAAAMITPENVIRILNQARVKFVLMGTHGISGWRGEPRATQDVDVLVRKSHHARAVKAIGRAYPDLLVEDLPAVTRFLDPVDGKPVIDLMKPGDELYEEVFKAPVAVGTSHHIPNLEVALACKFGALVSPLRPAAKKALDEADFLSMVQHNVNQIDMSALFSLGEMVKGGGGMEILAFVADSQAGRRLKQ